jgi:ectoine hydroxylase-related dioxygenase (phytanoyl-CoA dioxygenase family)
MKKYGITNKTNLLTDSEYHLENLRIKGYSIQSDLIDNETCDLFSDKLEKIYSNQESDFGKENLSKINELDICRMPFLFDNSFTQFFMNPLVLELTSKLIGENIQLHLQNGIINRPNKEHHQTSWHRDLPYQDWVISKPLAFNAFYCLSDFTETNGATFILPFSHNLDYFPSEKYVSENAVQLTAKKGSVILFNSMVFHKAGINYTNQIRYGLNNMFVVPILKQQIMTSRSIKESDFSEEVINILGHRFDVPESVTEFRNKRLKKSNK